MTTAREQTNELASMLRRERGGLVDFLLAFSDFHTDKRWRELEYASGFAYLRGEFKLSEGAAYNRIVAAELIHRVPEVAAALLSGALCFSTVTQVAKVVTPENKDELLPRFFRLSRSQAEQLAVSLRPVEVIPVREVVTALRPASAAARAAAALTASAEAAGASPGLRGETFQLRPGEVAAGMDGGPPGAQLHQMESTLPFGCDSLHQVKSSLPFGGDPPLEPPRDEIEPLDAQLARLHVTVSRRLLEKLESAKDALAHACPGATAADVFERGLDLVLAEHAKRKGLVEKPRKEPRPSSTDAVPAHVKRAVWLRAGGRCEWILPSGERCDCTRKLEYDHILALALGGKSTIDNVRLACRPHNLLAARQAFGDAVMDRYAPGRSPALR
jgi:5-methylcytosine-specific restriction endonuclease McrA